jgi:hypothetical protein
MARTSETITQIEVENWNRFCAKHNIINDGTEESKRFTNMVGEFVAITWGEDLTEQTLEIALQKFQEAGHTIPFKSAARIAFDRVADQCDPQLLKGFATWINTQTELENFGDQGFENGEAILGQLRGRSTFSADAAWAAVGRAQYSGKSLHFKNGPELDRSIVNGKINHAAKGGNQSFMSKSEARSSLDESYDSNPRRHKADPPPQPEAAPSKPFDAWTTILQKFRGAGNSHAQKEQVAAIFNSSLQPREKVSRIERILNPHLFQGR